MFIQPILGAKTKLKLYSTEKVITTTINNKKFIVSSVPYYSYNRADLISKTLSKIKSFRVRAGIIA